MREDVRKQYIALSHRHHPDLTDDPHAKAKMQRMNEAYRILYDPTLQERYEQVINVSSLQKQNTGSDAEKGSTIVLDRNGYFRK
jgi:DnaJ-class molecular chaperone